MSSAVIAFLTFAIFSTSLISGTFGMVGGMILMTIMLTILPLTAAVTVQSCVQLVSNSWRCILWRRHIVWHVLPWYLSGIAIGFILMLFMAYVPDRNYAFLMMGTFPLLSMVGGKYSRLHIENPLHTVPVAALLTFVHLTAGVIGPLLDLLYVNTPLTRKQIISTKAFTQTVMHLVRLGYYGLFISLVSGEGGWPDNLDPLWMIVFILSSIAGTSAAALIVQRMNDKHFKSISRVLIVIVSLYCLFQGITGLWGIEF